MSLTLLPSCAWSNVDNRPVWNAFESNLVPESGGLFAATLPLTVPLGLASIVVDTIIAHPLQVVDDAYDDAAELWDSEDLKFDEAYYTEMGFLPIRVLVTPIAFAGSGRKRLAGNSSARRSLRGCRRTARPVARLPSANGTRALKNRCGKRWLVMLAGVLAYTLACCARAMRRSAPMMANSACAIPTLWCAT